MPNLTYPQAARILDAAVRKANEIGQPMNIAIIDQGTNLLAFARMDGAILASIEISQRKAYTSMALQMSTADLGPLIQPGQPLYGINQLCGGLVGFGGGMVIKDQTGAAIGAIGVSAGSVEQDIAVAQAGLQAYSDSPT